MLLIRKTCIPENYINLITSCTLPYDIMVYYAVVPEIFLHCLLKALKRLIVSQKFQYSENTGILFIGIMYYSSMMVNVFEN